jgi:DUF4097 and DUF4098 domain-containing protein YvlB
VSGGALAHHRFDVSAHARFECDVVSGEVRVRNGVDGAISVTVETADPGTIEVVQLGDSVSVRRPAGWGGRRRQVVVTAEVPAGTDLRISATSAEVRLDGTFGSSRVHAVSGDITIDTIDRGEVDSGSGDIQLRASGSLEVSSLSGDINVHHVRGTLRASLTSGDLRADMVDGDVEVATMSGDVVIGRCDGDEIALRSVSGDLRLGLPAGITVEPEISTVSGSTTLPGGGAQPVDGPRRRVRLRLRTVAGDIRLERA